MDHLTMGQRLAQLVMDIAMSHAIHRLPNLQPRTQDPFDSITLARKKPQLLNHRHVIYQNPHIIRHLIDQATLQKRRKKFQQQSTHVI